MNTAPALVATSEVSSGTMTAPKTHETFVIGINKDGDITFLKSYDYLNQKEEAQSDVKWVQENCHAWHMGAMTEYRISHIEFGEAVSNHKIIIPHP